MIALLYIITIILLDAPILYSIIILLINFVDLNNNKLAHLVFERRMCNKIPSYLLDTKSKKTYCLRKNKAIRQSLIKYNVPDCLYFIILDYAKPAASFVNSVSNDHGLEVYNNDWSCLLDDDYRSTLSLSMALKSPGKSLDQKSPATPSGARSEYPHCKFNITFNQIIFPSNMNLVNKYKIVSLPIGLQFEFSIKSMEKIGHYNVFEYFYLDKRENKNIKLFLDFIECDVVAINNTSDTIEMSSITSDTIEINSIFGNLLFNNKPQLPNIQFFSHDIGNSDISYGFCILLTNRDESEQGGKSAVFVLDSLSVSNYRKEWSYCYYVRY